MKIKISILFLLMVSFSSLAQQKYRHLYPGYFGNGSSASPSGLRIGLQTGISRTDITKELLVNPNLEDSYEYVYKPHLGLMVQYGVGPSFILGTGLNYRPMAVNYKTTTSNEITTTQISKTYLEVPLLLNATMRKGEFNPYPAIYGGFSFAYLIDAKRDFESQLLDSDEGATSILNVDVSDDFNSLDYGITAGLSYYIPIQSYFQMMIDLKGYLGLANINNAPADAIVRPNTINTSVTLSIGLLWGR